MPTTDLSEREFEAHAVRLLTGAGLREERAGYDGAAGLAAGGWVEGAAADFDRRWLVDVPALLGFLGQTQPEAVAQLGIGEPGSRRDRFLDRLQRELAKRGVVDVLRRGIGHERVASLALFYGAPTPGNDLAAARAAANEFRVTRQLRYSLDERARALDLALLVNGLPVATVELKNQQTGQDVEDAIAQYRRDRSPAEPLFKPGRCAVHVALDEDLIRYCTELRGRESVFLPFDRGWEGGAGNPPNPRGLRTDWLWTEALAPASLADILENFAQVVGKGSRAQVVWPRWHQLDAVRLLLAHAARHGAGHRYLVEHSAGSGKSNTIAWLVHQLVDLPGPGGGPLFDTVIVVTDRRVLDDQLRATIRGFTHVAATVGAAHTSGDLRRFIEQGKRIVVSTVQKFPHILDEIGDAHRDRRFAVVVDEAHSSQGGRTTGAINRALGEAAEAGGEAEDDEDFVNRLLDERAASRRLLPNASYFAFTATPKNKTLELFGTPDPAWPEGRRPFHAYTMKQAIQEGFILDVLATYTPVRSWYRLEKTVEGDPEVEVRAAGRLLRRYVEQHDHAIATKAAIAAEHFQTKVAGGRKVRGEARAMVAVDGVERAIRWWQALQRELAETNSPYRAIVAFSGEREVDGQRVTEATLNGFPSAEIPARFREEPYRFLVVADKFQTGYDEPLLHTMYVDKVLAGVKAVQTLSRLNRAAPGKHDTFVLDFANDEETIRQAFAPYYQTTILSGATDPNKLHDLAGQLAGAGVFDPEEARQVVAAFLTSQPRTAIEPVLDRCVERYRALDEAGQVEFKGAAKAFVRTHAFLASVLDWANREWGELEVFLTLLLPKLPAPVGEAEVDDLLEMIDLDSYRAEVLATQAIALGDEAGVVDPVPVGAGGGTAEDERVRLSEVVAQFNDLFGNIEWQDDDRIRKVIAEELPALVAGDARYRNAIAQGDRANAREEHDRALVDAINGLLGDHLQLVQQYADNDDFRRWLGDLVFRATFRPPTARQQTLPGSVPPPPAP